MKTAQDIYNKLDGMNLSKEAREMIAACDQYSIYMFDGIETAEGVEQFVREYNRLTADWFCIIGTDGHTHGEAESLEQCEALLRDVEKALTEERGAEYVESLELEIVTR